MANQTFLCHSLTTKATECGEIAQNNGHYAVQGHSVSRLRWG